MMYYKNKIICYDSHHCNDAPVIILVTTCIRIFAKPDKYKVHIIHLNRRNFGRSIIFIGCDDSIYFYRTNNCCDFVKKCSVV